MSTVACLEILNLSYCSTRDPGGEALARADHMTELRLASNEIYSTAVIALAEAEHLSGLELLYLSGTDAYEEGARALADAEHLIELRVLEMSYNSLGAGGVAALADSAGFPRLRYLWLWSNDIGEEGEAALASATHLHESIREKWRD